MSIFNSKQDSKQVQELKVKLQTVRNKETIKKRELSKLVREEKEILAQIKRVKKDEHDDAKVQICKQAIQDLSKGAAYGKY